MSTAFSTKEIFGQKLSVLMADYDVTQTELAELLGVAQSAVSNYKRGERLPPLEEAMKLARHFKVSLDFLMGWESSASQVNVVTQVAEMMASKFSDDPIKQQEFFGEYVVVLSEARQAAVQLQSKLDELEWRTRMVLGAHKTKPEPVTGTVDADAQTLEKETKTRAQIGAAKMLAEAQQADVESGSSQTGQSTSDKTGAPKVPSRDNPGRRRTLPKPAPK